MVFIVDLINDSVVLHTMEDFNETTPQELYEKYGEAYLYNITNSLITDYRKLKKIYKGDYNFTDKDLLVLLNQLNFIDNKYLVDIIVLAKYINSDPFFIESNFNEDLLKIYREYPFDGSIFPYNTFIKRKNISIL